MASSLLRRGIGAARSGIRAHHRHQLLDARRTFSAGNNGIPEPEKPKSSKRRSIEECRRITDRMERDYKIDKWVIGYATLLGTYLYYKD